MTVIEQVMHYIMLF